MAILTHASVEEVAAFLADYAGTRGCSGEFDLVGVPQGTVNSSFELRFAQGRLFLRLYEEQGPEGARAEAARLVHLAERGVQTPSPLPRRDGGFVGTLRNRPAAIFPWIVGDIRCLRNVTPPDGRRVGEALARMHLAGLDAVREPGRFEAEALLGRLERIAAAPDPGLAAHAEPLRRRLHEWTGKRNPTLPRGLIHGDLFRDNVLWNNDGNIAAILDFESASDGALTYDLMVTVLAWSFRDDFDEAVARGIVGGYDAIRPISDEERMGLLAEAFIVALRFSITRITDEAMRAFEAGRPLRTDKDYRRFLKRIQRLEDLGHEGLMRLLFD